MVRRSLLTYFFFILEFNLTMNVTSGAEGQDVQTMIDNGEHFEAVLPLPTCRSNSGCRSVVVHDNNAPQPEQNFNLVDFVHINAEVSSRMKKRLFQNQIALENHLHFLLLCVLEWKLKESAVVSKIPMHFCNLFTRKL